MNPEDNKPQDQPAAQPPVGTPEPNGAPVPPAAPVAPFAPSAPGAPGAFNAPTATPAPNKQNPFNGPKKKLFIILAAVIGSLIVLGIITLVVLSALKPSKADYRAAISEFNNVQSSYSSLNSSVSLLNYDTGKTTDTKYENDLQKVRTNLDSFREANSKFLSTKAVKAGGLDTLDEYKEKTAAYVTYVKNAADSLEKYRPAEKKCTNDANTVALINECIAALDAVGTLPNDDLNTYVTKVKDLYKQYVDVVNQIAAIKDPYGAQYDQYKTIRDKGYDIEDKITDAATDLRSNDTKHIDEADPSTAANNLSDEIEKKQ
jgi:hypothetical protein